MADEPVAPARALLVIDVQQEHVDGALPTASPPLATGLPLIAAAIEPAHAGGVPVVLVRLVDAENVSVPASIVASGSPIGRIGLPEATRAAGSDARGAGRRKTCRP